MRLGLFASSFRRISFAAIGYVFVSAALLYSTAELSQGDPLPEDGLTLWRERNCVACHSLYGLGGHIGPDLTNTVKRRGAGYVAYVIREGKGAMPPQRVSDVEGGALVRYLESVGELGEYPLRSAPYAAFGNNR